MGVSVPAALALLVLAAQIVVEKPQEPGDPPRPVGRYYGDPIWVDLSSITFMGETYQDKHVRTRGTLLPLRPNQYWLLSDGSAQVLVLVISELALDLERHTGRPIEVRGIMRRIRKKEYIQGVDVDLLEHPDLPPLPAPSAESPPFSITVLAFSESDGPSGGRGRREQGSASAATLLAAPPPPGKRPRIVITGQFRGRNLFGDLPEATRRRPTDWVLREGDTALWVSGRPPRGKGWSLDPDYKADAGRWLEVTGTAEVVDGVLYVNASKLQLVKPPQQASSERDP